MRRAPAWLSPPRRGAPQEDKDAKAYHGDPAGKEHEEQGKDEPSSPASIERAHKHFKSHVDGLASTERNPRDGANLRGQRETVKHLWQHAV